MRRMDERLAVVSLSAVLQKCAREYCGAGNADGDVFDEAVDFVMSQFGHLGVDEVVEAFRLGAAGRFEVDMRAYYGQFPLVMLGAVLRGYDEYRAGIVAALRRAESEANYVAGQHQARTFWESEDGQRASRDFERRRVAALKAMEHPGLGDVTVYDYKILTALGELDLSKEEKWQLMADAKPFVEAELLEMTQGRGFGVAMEARAMLAGIGEGEGVRSKQVVLAQRLAVVRWVEAQRFLDYGEVADDRLRAISGRIERGDELSGFEMDVYVANSQRIEGFLRTAAAAALAPA